MIDGQGFDWLARVATLLTTMIGMEALTMLTHRYVMHGPGWLLHRSHHDPGKGGWEANDAYALVPAALAILLFWQAGGPARLEWWVAAGMTGYGICYAVLHDGLVHRRWARGWRPRHNYLKRLIAAHHLHHRTRERLGAVSYGFLYAPPLAKLRARLRDRT